MTEGPCLLYMTNGFTVLSIARFHRPDAEDAHRPSISLQLHRHLLSAISHVAREYIVNSRDGAMRVICYAILAA
jgi:hypothetical protein